MPDYLKQYDRDTWSKEIDELKKFVKPEASPGVPCAALSLRNDEYMSKLGERFNDLVLDRIETMLNTPLNALKEKTRTERIDDNLMDPVRVFVKQEPHKASKIAEGRVRLIMSVSLIDKMIEMILSRFICKLEIQNWRTIPSKPGIGFTPEMSRLVYRDVANSPYPMSYADVSGWDQSVKQWQIIDEAQALIKLCNNPSSDWAHLLILKAHLESESVYQFSDGLMVCPNFPGIVNSGKLRTSRGNSWMRVRLADLIGSRKVLAAGDDTVEATVADAPMKYAEYGITVKEYLPVKDTFEFCSHIYHEAGAYSVNRNKMIMNLLHNEFKDFKDYKASMIAFSDELGSRPDYNKILELIEKVGYYEVEGPHIEFE